MSDDEEIERVVTRNEEDDDDLNPKKAKKKKKSSSKKGEKSSSSSTASVVINPASKIGTLLSEYSQKLRGLLSSATNLSNTTRQATMARVVFLVILTCIIIGFGINMSLAGEEQEMAPVVAPEPEEVIVQKLPGKKSAKLSLAMEKDFGCRELQCVAQCNGKLNQSA